MSDGVMGTVLDLFDDKPLPKPSIKPVIKPTQLDVPKVLDDEFARLGYSPNARLALLSNVGRENNWNPNTIFGEHIDPASNTNGRGTILNRGIISWNAERRQALENFVRQNGGDFTPNENNLRLQARFLDWEMNNSRDPRVKRWKPINDRLKSNDLSLEEAYPLLQKYILYQPRYESDNKRKEQILLQQGYTPQQIQKVLDLFDNAPNGSTAQPDVIDLFGDTPEVVSQTVPNNLEAYQNYIAKLPKGETPKPLAEWQAGITPQVAPQVTPQVSQIAPVAPTVQNPTPTAPILDKFGRPQPVGGEDIPLNVKPQETYTRRDLTQLPENSQFYEFEQTGKSGKAEYLGMVGDKYRFKDEDGTEFEWDAQTQKQRTITPPQKVKFDNGIELTRDENQFGLTEDEYRYKDSKGNAYITTDGGNFQPEGVALEDNERQAQLRTQYNQFLQKNNKQDNEQSLNEFNQTLQTQQKPAKQEQRQQPTNQAQPEQRVITDGKNNRYVFDSDQSGDVGDGRYTLNGQKFIVKNGNIYSENEYFQIKDKLDFKEIREKLRYMGSDDPIARKEWATKQADQMVLSAVPNATIADIEASREKFPTSFDNSSGDEVNFSIKTDFLRTVADNRDFRLRAQRAEENRPALIEEIVRNDARNISEDEKRFDAEITARLNQGEIEPEQAAEYREQNQQETLRAKEEERASIRAELEKRRKDLVRQINSSGNGFGALSRSSDAFNKPITEEEIDAEMRWRNLTRLSREEVLEATTVGTNANVLSSGVIGGGGRTMSTLAGLMRPFVSDRLIPESWFAGVSKTGLKYQLAEQVNAEQNPGTVNFLLRTAGGLTSDLPRLAIFSRLPGGFPVALATDSSLQSLGRNESTDQAKIEGLKGGALGLVFMGGSKIAGMTTNFLARNLVPNKSLQKLFQGEISPTVRNASKGASNIRTVLTDPAAAAQTTTGFVGNEAGQVFNSVAGAETRNILGGETMRFPFSSYADRISRTAFRNLLSPEDIARLAKLDTGARNVLLAAKVLGEGTRLGSIFGGTYGVEKGFGADDKTALDSAAKMVILDFAMVNGGKIAGLAGKVVRVWKGKTFGDYMVDGEGNLRGYGKVGDQFVDVVVDAGEGFRNARNVNQNRTEPNFKGNLEGVRENVQPETPRTAETVLTTPRTDAVRETPKVSETPFTDAISETPKPSATPFTDAMRVSNPVETVETPEAVTEAVPVRDYSYIPSVESFKDTRDYKNVDSIRERIGGLTDAELIKYLDEFAPQVESLTEFGKLDLAARKEEAIKRGLINEQIKTPLAEESVLPSNVAESGFEAPDVTPTEAAQKITETPDPILTGLETQLAELGNQPSTPKVNKQIAAIEKKIARRKDILESDRNFDKSNPAYALSNPSQTYSRRDQKVYDGLSRNLSDLSAKFKKLKTGDEKHDFNKDLLRKAKVRQEGNELFLNPEAAELLRQAHQIAFGKAPEAILGAYQNPHNNVQVYQALRNGVLGSFQISAKPFLKAFEAAMDSPAGDTRIVAEDSNGRHVFAARQEEYAHQVDFQDLQEHSVSINVIPNNKIGQKAMSNLREGAYEGGSEAGLAIEVFAKLWVDNSNELGLSEAERLDLQNEVIDEAIRQGVPAETLLDAVSGISETGKKYAEQRKETTGDSSGISTDGVKNERRTKGEIEGTNSPAVRESRNAARTAKTELAPAYSIGSTAKTLISKLYEGRGADATPKKEVAVNFRRSGMLTGGLTHLKNMFSNALFQGTEEAMRPLALLADLATSAVTGTRTVQAPSIPGVFKAFRSLFMADKTMKGLNQASGIAKAWSIMKYGDIRELNRNQLSEMKSGSPLVDKFVNTTFRLLGAEDALFRTYAFRRSLEEQAKTLAITKARQNNPSNKLEYIRQEKQSILDNPTKDMILEATLFADFTTFTNSNTISDWFKTIKDINKGAKAGLEILVPYDKTPTNVILRTLEYTPAGFAMAGKHLLDWKKGESYTINQLKRGIEDEWDALDTNRQAARARIDQILDKLTTDGTALEADIATLEAIPTRTAAQDALLAKHKSDLKAVKKKIALYGKIVARRGVKDNFRDQDRKEIEKAIEKLFPRFQQQAFAKSFGRAGFGSSALALGMMLASAGLLSGIWDAGDKEERDEFYDNRDRGIMNGSLKLGNRRYVILDTPLGKVMTLGASIWERSQQKPKKGETKTGKVASDVYDVSKNLIMEQPMLNSLNDYFGSNKSVEKRISGLLGSFVPTVFSDIADLTDNEARENEDVWDGAQNRIPFLRNYNEKAKYPREEYLQKPENRLLSKIDPTKSRPVYTKEERQKMQIEKLEEQMGKEKDEKKKEVLKRRIERLKNQKPQSK